MDLKSHIRRFTLPKTLYSVHDFIEAKINDLQESELLHHHRKKQEPKKDDKKKSTASSFLVSSSSTDVAKQEQNKTSKSCPICLKLNKPGKHSLKDCFSFKNGNKDTRRKFIKEHSYCRHCLEPLHGYCSAYKKCEQCQTGHNPEISCERCLDNTVKTMSLLRGKGNPLRSTLTMWSP